LEDTVRALRCLLARLTGEGAVDETPELVALTRLLVHLDLFPARFQSRFTMAGVEREVIQLIYEAHRLGTVREVLARLRQIAFVLRDRFSTDTWRIVDQLQVEARSRPGRNQASEAYSLLNSLIVQLAAFSGMEMENMTRGHGWRFLEIGRRLERAVNVATLVQGAVAVQSEGLTVLEPILEIADSVMTYRRRYLAEPQLPSVLDLLLADETNPRSLRFQVNALLEHISNLPHQQEGAQASREMQQITAVEALLVQADPQTLAGATSAAECTALGELLSRGASELRSISDSLTHHYFSHAAARVS
jgi:uncharacterized alpha-E superfamily protein